MSNHLPQATPTVPGSILAGKYRVERIIGQGGMGVVVVARHIVLDERVALKFLLPEYATHPEASTRFLREAQAAVKIKSEHVARVSDVGTLETGAPYMVMEFLEGRDLSRLLIDEGVLQVEDAVDFVIQGSEALAEAHGYGIVHRDIKPANLFLTRRPNGLPLVKVLDFGISKTTGNQVDNLTKTTASMGSALYMSPEQMQASRGVDHRTDIYALGISLYELLAGKQPFYADTLPQLCAEIFTGTPTPIRSLRQDVPEGLANVLEKAYARDRGVRFQSVGELVVALAPYAPARSQVAIESVAKMAGLPVPMAGAPGVRVSAPPASPVVNLAGNAPVIGADTLRSGFPGASPGHAVMGGLPQTTGPGVSVANPPSIPVQSRAPLVVLALVALLGIGGGAAYLALHHSNAQTVSQAPSAPSPPAAPAAPGAGTPAATAAETAAPTAPAASTAVAATTASASPPSPTAPATTAAPPPTAVVVKGPVGGGRPKPPPVVAPPPVALPPPVAPPPVAPPRPVPRPGDPGF
jgi:serine/threonine-protein kinase